MRKATEINAVKFYYINLRNHGIGPRKQVDDTPYGGGDGMVLKPEPLAAAIKQAKKVVGKNATVIIPTPRGESFNQNDAKELAVSRAPKKLFKNKLGKKINSLIIICPRYEGYDERITTLIDKQYCMGSYILTGGEIPALSISDSVVRLLPGVLGGKESVQKESFQGTLDYIEHPHYTRPEVFNGQGVPAVLKSGNHSKIDKWRDKNSQKSS